MAIYTGTASEAFAPKILELHGELTSTIATLGKQVQVLFDSLDQAYHRGYQSFITELKKGVNALENTIVKQQTKIDRLESASELYLLRVKQDQVLRENQELRKKLTKEKSITKSKSEEINDLVAENEKLRVLIRKLRETEPTDQFAKQSVDSTIYATMPMIVQQRKTKRVQQLKSAFRAGTSRKRYESKRQDYSEKNRYSLLGQLSSSLQCEIQDGVRWQKPLRLVSLKR